MFRWAVIACAAALIAIGQATAQADKEKEKADAAKAALTVFTTHCKKCHGGGTNAGGVNYITELDLLVAKKKVIPNDPEQSRPLVRMKDEDDPMPPASQTLRPSKEEIAAVEKWIKLGAPPVKVDDKAPPRPLKSLREVLKTIRDHLREETLEENRPYQRYFTLTNIWNTPDNRLDGKKDDLLRLHRAALAKLLNSLSWRADLVFPKPIDKDETILVIDIRDLDWDRFGLWDKIKEAYPYKLNQELLPDDERLQDHFKEIDKLTGTKVAYIRADWFISTASQPPLYHTLLYDDVLAELQKRKRGTDPENPRGMTAYDLEQRLGLNVAVNFGRGTLARAGFADSGVSSQNRLVERHPAAYGAYWKSYDFKPNRGRADLFRQPLGPVFDLRYIEKKYQDDTLKYGKFAFEHDGGEAIFHLPNGLQGYLLVNAKGDRINKGPSDVVFDKKSVTGLNEIINGISCMTCHSEGMIGFKDEVAPGTKNLPVRDKVRQLYPPAKVMDDLVARDKQRFLAAVDLTTGKYLRVADGEQGKNISAPLAKDAKIDVKKINTFPEPVSVVGRRFLLRRIDVETAAAELGFLREDQGKEKGLVLASQRLADRIEGDDKFSTKLGLGPLGNGGTITREAWESRKDGPSPYQRAAQLLRLGEPIE